MKHDFHDLAIVDVRRETAHTLSFGLAVPPALSKSFRFAPGQHIGVRATIGGEEVRRTYSISSGPRDPLLWITIKRVEDGLFSNWAHRSLSVGDTLGCMAPSGRFVAQQANGRIMAIVAGSGITPVVSIIEHALARDPDGAYTLIYGNRTVDEIIFRERLEGLKNQHLQRLQIFHVLSRDSGEADVPLLSGRIDADKLARLASSMTLNRIDEVLLCGPDTLIKDARATLLSLGVPRERIRFEYFRAGPRSAVEPARTTARPQETTQVTGAEIVAILDGTRRTFRVAEGQHIIDAGLAQGFKLPYSCKGGMCCTCRAMLLEGEVVMDRNFSLQAWEMEAGFVLTCQSRPTTPRVVLDYDRS